MRKQGQASLCLRCQVHAQGLQPGFRWPARHLQAAHLRQGVQQQDGLAPGCVDLIPLHRLGAGAAQAEAGDEAKHAVAVDVEHLVQHVGAPQASLLGLQPVHLPTRMQGLSGLDP